MLRLSSHLHCLLFPVIDRFYFSRSVVECFAVDRERESDWVEKARTLMAMISYDSLGNLPLDFCITANCHDCPHSARLDGPRLIQIKGLTSLLRSSKRSCTAPAAVNVRCLYRLFQTPQSSPSLGMKKMVVYKVWHL